MDFEVSDEQRQLRDAVRRWVDGSYSLERRRAIEAAGGFCRDAWNELAELGFLGLYVPDSEGGAGLGGIEGMIVMEELGRGLILEPTVQALVCAVVLAGGDDATCFAGWLRQIAGGDSLVVLAQQERRSRYRFDVCDAIAELGPTGYRVSGEKYVIPAGDEADAFIVPARLEGHIALFLVEGATEDVRTRAYGLQDGGRAADVNFVQAPGQLVTKNGLKALDRAVAYGLAATCAEAVGILDRTFEMTAEYLTQRKQFGASLSEFQVLRHRIADMKAQLELARSMTYYATLSLDASPADRRMAVSRAKYQVGLSMRHIGQNAVQLHGGIGMTNEYVVSHCFRRLTQLEMTFGDTMHHLGEMSSELSEVVGVVV